MVALSEVAEDRNDISVFEFVAVSVQAIVQVP